MRVARPLRTLLFSALALAFAVGSLMHGPALALGAVPVDCHPAMGDNGHAGQAHHPSSAPSKVVPGCPLANLAAYLPIAPASAVCGRVCMKLRPLPSPLLTSVSLESPDPPPRTAA